MFDLSLMRPGGMAYMPKQPLPSANLNYITASLSQAIDPVGGGTYSGLTQVIHQGAGWRFFYTASPGLEIGGLFGARVLNGSRLGILGGAFLTVDALGTVEFVPTSIVTGSAVVMLAFEATSELSGEIDLSADVTNTGRWTYRPTTALADATQTVDTSQGERFRMPHPGGSRVVTLRQSTSPVPRDGERMMFIVDRGSSGDVVRLQREGSATFVATLAPIAAHPAIAEVVLEVGVWTLHMYNGQVTPGDDS